MIMKWMAPNIPVHLQDGGKPTTKMAQESGVCHLTVLSVAEDEDA